MGNEEEIIINVRQALRDIAQLKGSLADVRAQMGQTKAAGQNLFGADGAVREAQAIDALKKKYAEIVQAGNTLRTALKNAYDPRAIATYTQELAKLDAAQKKIEVGAKAAGVSLKGIGKEGSLAAGVVSEAFGAISKATIILAVLKGVYDLAKAGLELSNQYDKAKKQFTAFLGTAEKADQVLASLVATANKKFLNTDDVFEAGKSLLAFGIAAGALPQKLSEIADISAATGKNFNELALIYGKARTAGVLYAEDINQLVDAGIPIIEEFAKQMGVSTSEVKKLASEGKISFEELDLALFNLTATGGKFADQAEAQATTLPGLWQITVNRIKPYLAELGNALSSLAKYTLETLNLYLNALGVTGSTTEKQTRATEASVKRLQKARDEALLNKQIDNNTSTRSKFDKANQALIDEQRDLNEQLKDQAEDRLKLEDAAETKRLELAKKNGKAAADERKKRLKEQEDYNKKLAELQLQKLAPDSEAFAVAKENLRFADQLKEFKKFNLSTEEIEAIHQANLLDIRLDFENKRVAAEQESAKKLLDLYNKGVKDNEEAEKARTAAIQKEIENQRSIGNARIDVQEEINKGVIISLEKAGAKEADVKEAQRVFDLEIQRARLENELKFQLALLDATDAGNTAQIDATLAQVDKIKQQLKNVAADLAPDPAAKGKKKSFLELLGLSGDDLERGKKDLENFSNSIVSAFQDITAARLEEAEAAIETAQARVDAAQTAYDKEKELKDQGFANNLETATKNLEAAKAEEEKALKLKQDAQKKQLQLDTAMQLSSLVTAAANTFKGFSTIPLIGQILAVASIAAMFAAFAAARARASAAIKFEKGGEGYVDGNGIIQGNRHSDGGVKFEGQGGEFFGTDGRRFGVVNRAMTAKHFDILSAVNKGDNAAILRAASRLNRDAVNGAIGEGKGSTVAIIAKDDKTAHGLLKQIRDKRGEGSTTIENGYSVTRKGGRTTRKRL